MEDLDTKLKRMAHVEDPRDDDNRRVEWIDVGSYKRTSWATVATVLGLSIILHVALFYALPPHMFAINAPASMRTSQEQANMQKTHDIKVHMMHLPAVVKAKPPEQQIPPRYVQATDAPEKKPDETDNISSKDQQAAQKIESLDKTGVDPEVANGEDENSNALQTGTRKSAQPTVEQLVQQISKPSDNDTKNPDPRAAQKKQDAQLAIDKVDEPKVAAPPLPDAVKEDNPKFGTGKGIAEIKRTGRETKMPDKAPQDREIPAVMTNSIVRMEVPKAEASEASGMRPQPRPRLNLGGAMPTVIKLSRNGLATPTGSVAFDSKLSEYGDYLSRMFEAISIRWNDLNDSSPLSVKDAESYVRVSFFVTREGQIENLSVVDTNATQGAQWRCMDAIQSNAPYNSWTKDMVVILGTRQQVLVQFYYR
jgi:hypothetical protein